MIFEISFTVYAGGFAIQATPSMRVGDSVSIPMPATFGSKKYLSAEVVGHSMSPKIKSGDIVTAQKIGLLNNFYFSKTEEEKVEKLKKHFNKYMGEIFIIDTGKAPLLKSLVGFDEEQGLPVFDSLNPDYSAPEITDLNRLCGNLFRVNYINGAEVE